MYSVGIITASDKASRGERIDESGKMIENIMAGTGFEVTHKVIVEDDKEKLKEAMIHMSDELGISLIFTTGGTGFSPRDITPEATIEVSDRLAPGISEAIRNYSMTITKRAMLSRATSAIRNKTLIINLPGSPKAVKESLEFIVPVLKHGLDILCENDGECAR